jgi:hypothetical protein
MPPLSQKDIVAENTKAAQSAQRKAVPSKINELIEN